MTLLQLQRRLNVLLILYQHNKEKELFENYSGTATIAWWQFTACVLADHKWVINPYVVIGQPRSLLNWMTNNEMVRFVFHQKKAKTITTTTNFNAEKELSSLTTTTTFLVFIIYEIWSSAGTESRRNTHPGGQASRSIISRIDRILAHCRPFWYTHHSKLNLSRFSFFRNLSGTGISGQSMERI